MLNLHILGHDFHYELENLCRLFFPDEKITILRQPPVDDADRVVTEIVSGDPAKLFAEVRIGGYEPLRTSGESADPADSERELAVLLFGLLCRLCGYTPPWGILTGVRPAKLMGRLVAAEGPERARQYFREKLLVSEEKTRLAMQTAEAGARIAQKGAGRAFSLYLSVPFCPTRCAYCSFVSHSAPKALKMLPEYVEHLCREIEDTAALADENGLQLRSIYVGGGTPTVLTAAQLRQVLAAVDRCFRPGADIEYTVEAGRPDTVTPEKFEILRRFGVNRVSVNPQTMRDDVLRKIGRAHDTAQTLAAVKLAKEYGFPVLNMDLIAGLPGDDYAGFAESLDRVLESKPDNVTIHTLAIKRAARLASLEETGAAAHAVERMHARAAEVLAREGLSPYYLYRQSRSVGNFENVGFAKPGTECLYNVFMMDEIHTVLGCGAGAVTKFKNPHGDLIRRVFNHKYPYEYIARFDELTERKKQVSLFYAECETSLQPE